MNIKYILIAKNLNKSSTTGKTCFFSCLFILKDKIKTVDTLVHIIQLLKPGCHCHKSHSINFANYFRQSFTALKEAVDIGFTLIHKSFLVLTILIFFSYEHHYASPTVSSTKSRSTQCVEIAETLNNAKRWCNLQMFVIKTKR